MHKDTQLHPTTLPLALGACADRLELMFRRGVAHLDEQTDIGIAADALTEWSRQQRKAAAGRVLQRLFAQMDDYVADEPYKLNFEQRVSLFVAAGILRRGDPTPA